MARQSHPGNHSIFAILSCELLHPCLECLEAGFAVAELQQFLCVLVVVSVECPGIVDLTSHINSDNQSFSVMDAILAFCMLPFILDPSLFNRIFTNRPKSAILF